MADLVLVRSMKHVILLAAVAIIGTACSTISPTAVQLPNGLYREPSGVETVEVSANEMKFHIKLLNRSLPGIYVRTYRYELLTNGQIFFPASSASSGTVMLEGVSQYKWSWDGKHIVRLRIRYFFDEQGNPQKAIGSRVVFTGH
jgi:hypothetical protein